MTAPLPTLAFLAYHWGDAYLISYAKDRWVALRRDTRYFLVADSLAELEKLITADYRRQPVSRDLDPLQDADYPTFPDIFTNPDADEGLDAETRIIMRELRRAFPAWAITFSTETRTWVGKTRRNKTVSVNSAVELCIVLALTERRARQASNDRTKSERRRLPAFRAAQHCAPSRPCGYRLWWDPRGCGSRSVCLSSFACKRTMAVAGPGFGVGRRGPLIDSAWSMLVTGCCVHDRGRRQRSAAAGSGHPNAILGRDSKQR